MGEFVMHRLFPIVCNMSLTASVVILAVLAVRLLLRRAPKVFSYALWAVVLFRLLCPVSVTPPPCPCWGRWALRHRSEVPLPAWWSMSRRTSSAIWSPR